MAGDSAAAMWNGAERARLENGIVLWPAQESGTKVNTNCPESATGKGEARESWSCGWLAGSAVAGNPVSRKSGKVGTFIVRRKRSKTVVRTLSVTRIVNVKAPGVVGDPLIMPVFASRVRPSGCP